jgi:hypothetical protein
MLYTNTVMVLEKSKIRMTQENLYTFSHRKDGFIFYTLTLNDKSTNQDMTFLEDSLTRQGIPCVIFPDRLDDEVICVKYSSKGDLIRSALSYKELIQAEGIPQLDEVHHTNLYDFISLINDWDNQVQGGNIYSLKQFIKPDEE